MNPRITSLPATRLAIAGLALVLLVLTAFAVGGAITTSRSAESARTQSSLSDAYQQARYAVGAEESLRREYRLEPSPAVTGAHAARGRQLEAALRRVEELRPQDGPLVERVLAQHTRYVRAAAYLFSRDEASDSRQVSEPDERVDGEFRTIETAVDRQAARNHVAAVASLRALRDAEDGVLFATPVAFAVGLILLAAFAVMLIAYRRRIDEDSRRELARLAHAALTDPLTGLRNHRAFHEDLARELLRAARAGRPVSLVILDLDGLKGVNDSLGHQAGDQHLQALADGLRETLRGADAGYRLGGDEFAAILADEQQWAAYTFAQRLQQNLTAWTGGTVSATAGVAATDELIPRDELIRRADLALIAAKRSGFGVLLWTADLEPSERQADPGDQEHASTLAAALARAVDAKDAYTRSHSQTVADLCAMIGTQLGLGAERVARLRLAGLLHDVGKIGISDQILQKPAKLTDAEYEVMKTHASVGNEIVTAAALPDEARWVLYHHERIDGGGYPNGLHGEEIPLESRIMAVADSFEAIVSDRPYREARSQGEALAELRRCAGTQFDPSCVDALETALAAPAPAPAAPAAAALAA